MNSSNETHTVELGLMCIVLILYIVGKVWMYYKIEDRGNKETNKSNRYDNK